MTISEFYSKAEEAIQLPLFYERMDVEQEEELPPIYIYFVAGETNIFEADNIVYWSNTPVEMVIVHGDSSINEAAKATTELFLNNNRLPFTNVDTYDNELTSWLTTYSFNI